MKVSLESIKKLTPISVPIDDLIAKVFTQIGAVEHIQDLSKKYEGTLVAKIIQKRAHPDSDKLGVYMVDIGSDTLVQVVAGDKTLNEGDMVAYFSLGAKLPYNASPEKNEDVVKKVKLRGVDSEGMMASAKELDLSNDHTKIMRLDTDLPTGSLFAKAYGMEDTLIEIENKAIANRADCFGLLGIAREIAAIQRTLFESPKWYSDPQTNKPEEGKKYTLEVDNQNQINCPRYMGVIIENVKVDQSPMWLKVELAKAGIKPINNVVDVTNYLMHLTSQPLHAFDFDKVSAGDSEGRGCKIVVRQAKSGENVLGINGKVLELDESMTAICDSRTPIAIAGIIGGAQTEVGDNTQTIILECANFNRYNIRKTSWKLGLFTDAATRYTKAQSPSNCEPVLYQAIKLISELTGGSVASNIADVYPEPKMQKELRLDINRFNKVSGLNISKTEIVEILKGIEYGVKEIDGSIKLGIPLFREDVNIIEDVYEDIERIYGFNAIEVTLPKKSLLPAKNNRVLDFKRKVRSLLASLGANEVLTYNFVSNNDLTDFGLDLNQAFHLKNSLSPELEFMRINLLPSLLNKMSENINRGYSNQTLFEINIGHNQTEKDKEGLPLERWTVALVTAQGNVESNASSYYDVKVYLDQIQKKLNLKQLDYTLLADTDSTSLPQWIKIQSNQYNMNRSAIVTYNQEAKKIFVGLIGEISNQVRYTRGLPISSAGFELDLEALYNGISDRSRYQEPSKYPKISQDLCFVTTKAVPYLEMLIEIEQVLKATRMYYEVEPVDIYSSEKDPKNKQVTFRVSLQSHDKTLQTQEYDKVKEKLEYVMNEKFQAKLV